MNVFGLVHGGSHGAWCWERLIPQLERLGSSALAMDLPIDQADSGAERCAQVVAESLAGVESPILVGHSIAGAFLPLAAQLSGARAMVFLCAMIPVEGASLADQQAAEPSMVAYPYHLLRDDQGRTLATREVARAMYYPDCSEADIDWAVARLRPQAPTLRASPYPRRAWPDLPARYILCTGDTVVANDWSRRAARERLGVEPLELPGGHSPFLSQVGPLAGLLQRIADELSAAGSAG